MAPFCAIETEALEIEAYSIEDLVLHDKATFTHIAGYQGEISQF